MSQRKNPITDQKTFTLKSPLQGKVFLAQTPADKPCVEIGQAVKKGDAICYIESMKMFTKIEADRDGIITERHVDNNDIVAASHSLFTIQATPKATLSKPHGQSTQHSNLIAHQNELRRKVKKLKAYVRNNNIKGFEDCASKLDDAVASALEANANLPAKIQKLDTAWGNYWDETSNTYHFDAVLKKMIIGIYTVLGAIAGCIAGMAVAPLAPYSPVVGLAAGAVAGGFAGKFFADWCFFNNSKTQLANAVEISSQIKEIKDDIEVVFTRKI